MFFTSWTLLELETAPQVDCMILRHYQPADDDEVWFLHKLALDGVGANAGDGPWNDDLHDIDEAYPRNGGEFLVGHVDGRLVVMGALRRVDDEIAEIKRMRVHPNFQRKGFGQAMLTVLEERAAQLGYTKIVLDTTDRQKAAQALYEKHGYVEVGRKVANFPGTGEIGIILYEKSLI